jgi:hypothetical protein
MNKKHIAIISMVITNAIGSLAQYQSMRLQGKAFLSNGSLVQNEAVVVEYSIWNYTENNFSLLYKEEFNCETNDLGYFNFQTGQGSLIAGNIEQIPWHQGNKWEQMRLNYNGMYTPLLWKEMTAVPYVLRSKSTGIRYSPTGDTLFYGGNHKIIIPGISNANPQ